LLSALRPFGFPMAVDRKRLRMSHFAIPSLILQTVFVCLPPLLAVIVVAAEGGGVVGRLLNGEDDFAASVGLKVTDRRQIEQRSYRTVQITDVVSSVLLTLVDLATNVILIMCAIKPGLPELNSMVREQ